MDSVLGRGDIGNLTDDSSGDEVIDDGEQELEAVEQLPISAAEVERNYALMGVLCEPEEPAQSLEQLRQEYPQAFSDISEKALSETLEELNLPFALSPFQVEEFLLEMLHSYGAICYWDPEYLDPMAERTCDVFLMARDQTIRLIISLCLKQCERENDALGLRTLRRIMISYFRNKSKEATSAYARNLVMDLVVEESSSERSRARMDNHVCVNPSGTRGGHLFRDKVNEHYVQQVKVQLGRQHSDHHDVQVQTLIKSLSSMQSLHRHNLKARGHETAGQSHSSDTVGDELRAEMMAITREADPFNLDRPAVRHSGSLHSSGSPFASLKLATMEAYIESVKENFAMLYVDRLHPKRRH